MEFVNSIEQLVQGLVEFIELTYLETQQNSASRFN